MTVTLLVSLALVPVLSAQTVYRSVEDGVPTFSDTPPAGAEEAEEIVLRTPPAADAAELEERLAQMRDTTDRMAADRRERELHRAELRRVRNADEQAGSTSPGAVAGPAIVTGGAGYWPVYGRPVHRWRPPLRAPHWHTPTPWQTPTPPPGWSVLGPGNAQLMRPIVSDRR